MIEPSPIYFVTAIGTDSGKTIISAILAKALQADYWKPIQCGFPTDSSTIAGLVDNMHIVIHDESYILQAPMSPHAAAKAEGVNISLDKLYLPPIENNPLIIEGAGGMLVPLNDTEMVIDIAAKFDAEVILVANLYLGSINHTLLSVNELKRRNIKVKGVIFNGPENHESEAFILQYSGYSCLLKVRPAASIDGEFINKYAIQLFDHWND
jgi:dethiobiotin synthetase